jgi:hypothetical protein
MKYKTGKQVLAAIKKFVKGQVLVPGEDLCEKVNWHTPHNHAIALVLMQLDDPQETGELLEEIESAFLSS